MNDPTTLADFKGTVRLFPLPNLVLFPQVVQGLHIFEPRYRQLMADALSTDQLITLVLLKPGWEENYDGTPAIEPVACLGRVTWHEQLPDGRYNLRLRGAARVQILEEIPTNRLYRIARAGLIPDLAPPDLDTLREHRRSLAEVVLPRFDDGPARRQLQELFDGEMPLGQVCDVLAYALPLPMEIKQSLLAEPHADRRVLAIVDALRASAARADRKFPPEFSPN
jgi:uncharacterized protein